MPAKREMPHPPHIDPFIFPLRKRLELDFKGMIQRAQDVIVKERDTRWYDWERYSALSLFL